METITRPIIQSSLIRQYDADRQFGVRVMSSAEDIPHGRIIGNREVSTLNCCEQGNAFIHTRFVECIRDLASMELR